jgi:hypothetical protein
MGMEKRLISVAYWIGILCAVVALINRGLMIIGVSLLPLAGSPAAKTPLSSKSFLDAAILFFVMAIASFAAWRARAQKS